MVYRMLGPYRDRNTLTPEENQAIMPMRREAQKSRVPIAQSHSSDEVKAFNQLKARYDMNASAIPGSVRQALVAGDSH